MRRYFIMDVTKAQNEDYLKSLEMCIGEKHTQRHNLDKTKLIIKTTQNDIYNMLLEYPQYTFNQIMELTFCQEYSYDEMIEILKQPEWSNDVII